MAAEPGQNTVADSIAARLVRMYSVRGSATTGRRLGGGAVSLAFIRNPGTIDVDDHVADDDDIQVYVKWFSHLRMVTSDWEDSFRRAPTDSEIAEEKMFCVRWMKQIVHLVSRHPGQQATDHILVGRDGFGKVVARIRRHEVHSDDELLALMLRHSVDAASRWKAAYGS